MSAYEQLHEDADSISVAPPRRRQRGCGCWVAGLLSLLLFAAAGTAGYHLTKWIAARVRGHSMPAEQPSMEPSGGSERLGIFRRPKQSAPPSVEPTHEEKRITCGLCKGTGKLSRPDWNVHMYECPVCNGTRGRSLKIRPGFTTCPNCGGMGKTAHRDDLFRSRKTQRADLCLTCRGGGVVRTDG